MGGDIGTSSARDHKRRRDESVTHVDDRVVEQLERKRKHTLRAYFKTLHEMRHEVQSFQQFANDVEMELRSEFNDITPTFIMDKVTLFLKRLRHFGHCPLSGDAIHELTYINHCGHVFNKISLEEMSNVTHCPLCKQPLGYPYSSKQ